MKKLLYLPIFLMASLTSIAQIVHPINPPDSLKGGVIATFPKNHTSWDLGTGIGGPTFKSLCLPTWSADSVNIEAWPASGIRIVKDTLILDSPSFHFIRFKALTYSVSELAEFKLQILLMERKAEKTQEYIDGLYVHFRDYQFASYIPDQQPGKKILPRPVYCKATGLWAILSGTYDGQQSFWGLASSDDYIGVPGHPSPILKKYKLYVEPGKEATFPDRMTTWIEICKWERAFKIWDYETRIKDSIEKAKQIAKHIYQ